MHCKRMLPFRGVPLFIWAWVVHWGRVRSVPRPVLPTRVLRALLGMGGALFFFFVLVPVVRGVPCWCGWGSPSVPLLHAVGVHF